MSTAPDNFETRMTVRLVVAVGLLLVLVALVILNSRQAETRQEAVVRAHGVLTDIAHLRGLVQDSLASQRAWALTQDASELARFEAAQNEWPEVVDRLRIASRENPAQLGNLDQVTGLIRQRMDATRELVVVREREGLPAMVNLMSHFDGRRQTENILALTTAMEEEEKRLLTRRNEQADEATRTNFLLYALVISCDCILIVALFHSTQTTAERRRAHQAERESQAHFQAMADTAPVLLWMSNVKGAMTFFNQSWFDFTGRTPQQENGHGWLEGVHRDDAERVKAAHAKAAAGHEPWEIEFRLRAANGNYHTVLAKGAPRHESDQKVVGFIGSCIDITRRKRAEVDLAEEKERLAVTLRSIGDGVITTDDSGRIFLMNNVAEAITGWSQQDAIGRRLSHVFLLRRPGMSSAEISRELDAPARSAESTGHLLGSSTPAPLIAKDGRERLIAHTAAPILNEEKHAIGRVLVFRDVTERERIAREMMKASKLESIGLLAGGIAHDFNNILTTIIGNVSLAMQTSQEAGQRVHCLRDAEKAALRARDLTQQLLTFAKGGAPIKTTSYLHDVIRDSAEFGLHGASVAAKFSLPKNLAAVEIDAGQISQVIHNIVLNAAQAMPGGGEIEIIAENVHGMPVGATSSQDSSPAGSADHRAGKGAPVFPAQAVMISIADRGSGISPEHLQQIFDPYFTTKPSGSGLGLATCYSIVKRHGGNITVESKLGEGTVFRIYLPASAQPQAAGQIAKPASRDESPPGEGRVLVMDDDELLGEMIPTMLSLLGYESVMVRNGEEAIETYREAMRSGPPFNACILDLTIVGGMSGRDTIKALHLLDPKVRAIVSSGYSNDPIMADYGKYGFCGMVCKPYRLEDLGQELKRMLSFDGCGPVNREAPEMIASDVA